MIESTDSAIVVSGPEGIRAYDVLSFRATLGLEIRTGMVMRSGFDLVMAAVLRGYVSEDVLAIRSKDKRKRAAYAQVDALAASLPGQTSKPLAPKAP